MSKSSTSKEKHANPNLPPIYENKRSQFRFVSPQDRIGDKNHITKEIKILFAMCFCMTKPFVDKY